MGRRSELALVCFGLSPLNYSTRLVHDKMTTQNMRQRQAGATKQAEQEPLIEQSEEERLKTAHWTQRIESLYALVA